MEVKISFPVAVILSILPLSTVALLPNGECSVLDMTCQLDNENVIAIISDVAAAEDCRQQCEDDPAECSTYSYYGPSGAPFRETCFLFNSCSALQPAEDCFTEEVQCSKFCHASVEGIVSNENLINYVANVNETACETECDAEEECKFFTYYWPNATTFPSTCFLLRQIQGCNSIDIMALG